MFHTVPSKLTKIAASWFSSERKRERDREKDIQRQTHAERDRDRNWFYC